MQTKDRSLVEAIFNSMVSVIIYGTTIVVLTELDMTVLRQAVVLFIVAVLKNYTIRRVANLGDTGGQDG